jgi:transposase-like protein
MAHFKYDDHHNNVSDSNMEEWDQASNDFVLRCNSCWRTNASTKIIRTSREKYYCLDCLATFDLCHG